MNQLNSIIIEGNLVRDAVYSEPSDGFKVSKMVVAVNRFYKNKNDEAVDEVSFFDVEAYGKSAEYCEKMATKGRGIRVVGRLKQSVWKDENGKSNSRILIVAEHIEYKPVFNNNDEKNVKVSKEEASVSSTEPAEETVF